MEEKNKQTSSAPGPQNAPVTKPAEKPLVMPEVVQPENVQLAKANEFTEFGNPEALRTYAMLLWNSGLNAFDKPEDVATVMVWAHELKMPIVSALSHSLVVNSKHGIDSHLARALVSRAAITCETLEDYKPIYTYTTKVGENIVSYSEDDVLSNPTEFKVFLSGSQIAALMKSGDIVNGMYKGQIAVLRSDQPVDYRTVLKFTRHQRLPTGKFVELIEYGAFCLSEAEHAELLKKSNWQNWPKDCCYSRAYMRGARRIADDYLMGAYSKLELIDTLDEDVALNQEEL